MNNRKRTIERGKKCKNILFPFHINCTTDVEIYAYASPSNATPPSSNARTVEVTSKFPGY
jgi:hypothetical protein